jgi:hypothetical protein
VPGHAANAAPPRNAGTVRITATPHERALVAADAAAAPSDLAAAPASTAGWLQLQIGNWQYVVPPDHAWATTGATPSGIDITSTDTAHFGLGFVSNDPNYSVQQVAALVFDYGLEDAGIAQYAVTATEGPFPGPAGTQEEIVSWTGTRRDGTAVTGDVEAEASPVEWITYELDGPSASWGTDLPVLLAIKANCMFNPSEQPSAQLRHG